MLPFFLLLNNLLLNSNNNIEKKNIHLYYILGMLNEYMGRINYIKNYDIVEFFYSHESAIAKRFYTLCNKLKKEKNINTFFYRWPIFRKKNGWIIYHSNKLKNFINLNYNFYIGMGSSKKNGKTYCGILKEDIFNKCSNEDKIAYLAGAYFRYGKNSSFDFANSYNKVKNIEKLLKDIGAKNIKVIINNGAGIKVMIVPTDYKIYFELNEEMLNKIKNYYENYLK